LKNSLRLISLFLTLVMLLGSLPVFAEEGETQVIEIPIATSAPVQEQNSDNIDNNARAQKGEGH